MNIGDKYGCMIIESIEGDMYKCKCKCGKIRSFDQATLEANPKYCSYPMFISTRMTYSVKAANATYRKQQKYEKMMNVHFVINRSECIPSEEYCGLWNSYKTKEMNRKKSVENEKEYTVEENVPNGGIKHTVYATSHMEALKKVFPRDVFELVPQSDIRNRSAAIWLDYDVRVSNDYRNSAQYRSRLYKRI